MHSISPLSNAILPKRNLHSLPISQRTWTRFLSFLLVPLSFTYSNVWHTRSSLYSIQLGISFYLNVDITTHCLVNQEIARKVPIKSLLSCSRARKRESSCVVRRAGFYGRSQLKDYDSLTSEFGNTAVRKRRCEVDQIRRKPGNTAWAKHRDDNSETRRDEDWHHELFGLCSPSVVNHPVWLQSTAKGESSPLSPTWLLVCPIYESRAKCARVSIWIFILARLPGHASHCVYNKAASKRSGTKVRISSGKWSGTARRYPLSEIWSEWKATATHLRSRACICQTVSIEQM